MNSIGSYPLNQVIHGDSRELAKSIPDNSIDLIFTDPIYQNKDDYVWLSELGKRILKPSGSLLCWSNGTWHKVNTEWLETHLVYRWNFSHLWRPGPGKLQGKIIAKANHVLWFSKEPETKMIDYLADGHITQRWSKPYSHNHHWTKDPGYIEKAICAFEHGIVYDPFAGGGTIPAVCKTIGVPFIASEIEAESVKLSVSRLAETAYAPEFSAMAETKPNKVLQPTAFGVGMQAEFPLHDFRNAEESPAINGGG